jgi:hypothetical protein
MIVYQSTKSEFVKVANTRDIQDVILEAFEARMRRRVAPNEVRSWKESLQAMSKVLTSDAIPDDCGVAIEYGIPQTSKRVDMLLSGRDEAGRANLIIIELKQWERATRTSMDAVVRTRFAHGESDCSHPSYQSWSYAELLRNFNETVDHEAVPLQPCAYLHNCRTGGDLLDPFYARYLELAPVFLAGEAERAKLRAFIAQHVRKGDRGELIYRIDQGRIRPSRRLIDALKGMMAGKREFVLIDDQKLVYETALAKSREAQSGTKQVVIVDGGPGTGKSVVAVNLVAALNNEGRNVRYVSKNRAPRQVIEHTLAGTLRRSIITNLFGSSGSFVDTEPDVFDTLIVDEAHRLNEKSGLYGNQGEHQVSEIIRAARSAIFFIDEDQRVTWKDIGRRDDIADPRARKAPKSRCCDWNPSFAATAQTGISLGSTTLSASEARPTGCSIPTSTISGYSIHRNRFKHSSKRATRRPTAPEWWRGTAGIGRARRIRMRWTWSFRSTALECSGTSRRMRGCGSPRRIPCGRLAAFTPARGSRSTTLV